MEPIFHYETVSEAITELRNQGFTTDFNLNENFLHFNGLVFEPQQFEIVQVYRYEGNSDPADEATVYAIISDSGLKGILVTGYSANMDNVSPQMLSKLHYNPK